MIKVVNDRGRVFNVRVVLKGQNYGLNDCLVHNSTIDSPLIEFYDATYEGKKDFGERGQFVSRYFLDTLQEGNPYCGVSLQGDEPVWSITAGNKMDAVLYGLEVLNRQKEIYEYK